MKEDSATFNSSHSLGRILSPAKMSFDFDMHGKRQAVVAEEFEDIQNKLESVRVLERCGTEPLHSNWGSHKGSWEITHDIDALVAEYGIEHEFTDREKIQGHPLDDI